MKFHELMAKRGWLLEREAVYEALVELLRSEFRSRDSSPEPKRRILITGTASMVSPQGIDKVILELEEERRKTLEQVEAIDGESAT